MATGRLLVTCLLKRLSSAKSWRRMKDRKGIYLLLTITAFLMLVYVYAIKHCVQPRIQLHVDQIIRLQKLVYKERQQHALDGCVNKESGHVGRVYLQSESKLAYCPVAKIGCTFWKRVFLFLNNDTGDATVHSPFQIPRHFVHFGKRKRTKTIPWKTTLENEIQNYTRFLFTRDPYSRLWSAYLDKFFLPDFWWIYGNRVTRNRARVSTKAAKCHNDISFQEFLEYVLSIPPRMMNDHWQPVKYTCDPCLFKPDIIGKQETFIDDAQFTLKDTRLNWVLSTLDYNAYVEEELSMLTEYNFELLKYAFFRNCTDNESLAKLLWQVFQMNGYLPKDLEAQSAVDILGGNINKETFKWFVLKTYRSASEADRRQWKLQKRETLNNVYSRIPDFIIKSIREVYKDDFEMFGYSTLPPGMTNNGI